MRKEGFEEMAKRIYTVRDAVQERHAYDTMLEEKHRLKNQKWQIPENLHPAIGVLMTAKGVKFYAYIGKEYVEGTAETLMERMTNHG